MTGMVGDDKSATVFGGYSRIEAGPIFSGSHIGARQVEDGLSKTIAIGERHLPPVPPSTPDDMKDYAIGDTAAIPGDTPHTTFRCASTTVWPPVPTTRAARNSAARMPAESCSSCFWMATFAACGPTSRLEVLKALCTIGGGEVAPDDN